MNDQPKHLERLEALAEKAKYEKIDLFSELKEAFQGDLKQCDNSDSPILNSDFRGNK